MAEQNDTPLDTPLTIDQIEQRMAQRLLRYFLASIGTIVLSAFALGQYVASASSRIDSQEKRLDAIESTVQADAEFKSNTEKSLSTLEERTTTLNKSVDRMDNKLDRVIRVYEVPK